MPPKRARRVRRVVLGTGQLQVAIIGGRFTLGIDIDIQKVNHQYVGKRVRLIADVIGGGEAV